MVPRRIRLVRAPTLPALHAAAAKLCRHDDLARVRDTAILLPSRAAAAQLRLTLEHLALGEAAGPAVLALPEMLTRDEWYTRLHTRLGVAPRILSGLEREVLLGAAARAAVDRGAAPPFRMRPALVAEMLQFYDALARHQRTIDDFERLVVGDVEPRAEYDRGAERLLRQTRFLVAAFREFDGRMAELGALDEHGLRRHLLAPGGGAGFRHVVVTVGDRATDPAGGLFQADFDLLARMPGIETVDLVCTHNVLVSGWQERLRSLLPGLEECEAEPVPRAPLLLVPPGPAGKRVFTSRDREEELREIARRVKSDARAAERSGAPVALDRTALVFKRPLPYVYLARTVFGSAGVAFQAADALPLAAEPYAAALSLVFDAVASRFNRASLVALLRSPLFAFHVPRDPAPVVPGSSPAPDAAAGAGRDDREVTPESVSALDAALADAGYLGDPARLEALVPAFTGPERPAALAAAAAASELQPLSRRAAVSAHLDALLAFVRGHEQPPGGDEALRARHLRARAAILSAIEALGDAARRYDDPVGRFADVAATIRRWIQAQTFSPRLGDSGVQLVDACAARFADIDTLYLAGLAEGDWPEARGANILYPSFLLAELGWPSEQARAAAERAAFADLLRLARTRLGASTFTLEDDALVEASPLLDELDRAGLASCAAEVPATRVFADEALTAPCGRPAAVEGTAAGWRDLRQARSSRSAPEFHGMAAPAPLPRYSVTAIDRYLDCPFKYFAVSVLELPEEPADDEGMTPLERGTFIHEVFHAFFAEWQAAGHGAITVENIADARRLFAAVASARLERLPPADAALERFRVLGSVASPGLGEIVLASEAARPEPVRSRLLEFPFDGEFVLAGREATRRVRLRGVIDRADLLADGRLRLVDYKIGRAPEPRRTVQLPIYMTCLPQYLSRTRGEQWEAGEAFYMAFGEAEPEQVVIGPRTDVAGLLAESQQRLLDAVDGIERGAFPPRPSSPRRCATCAYAGVCRKDYAGAE